MILFHRDINGDDGKMGVLNKMLNKSKKPKKEDEYKVEFVDNKHQIGDIDVGGKSNPKKDRSQREPEPSQDEPDEQQDKPQTVPLFAKYDELGVAQVQLLQEILAQQQKNTQMLVKLYEFFVEQSKE